MKNSPVAINDQILALIPRIYNSSNKEELIAQYRERANLYNLLVGFKAFDIHFSAWHICAAKTVKIRPAISEE